MRLLSGRTHLRVLPVSGAVRQRWPPEPTGRAADDAERTRGSSRAAAGEEATRAGERSVREGASRGIGEGGSHNRARKRPGTTERLSIPPQPGTGAGKRRGDANATEDTADGEGESGDVPGYVPTPEDLRFSEVYGDWVHGNLGTHLDG